MSSRNNRRIAVIGALSASVALACMCGAALAWDDQYLDRMDSITPGFGNAVAHNKAVQMVNPWPYYVRNNKIHIAGPRIAIGHSRYLANKSTAPGGIETSSIRYRNIGTNDGGNGQ